MNVFVQLFSAFSTFEFPRPKSANIHSIVALPVVKPIRIDLRMNLFSYFRLKFGQGGQLFWFDRKCFDKRQF